MRLRNIVAAGIFAALICIVTFFIKIPLGQISGGAYINLGDLVIYIVAALINPLYAFLAAGVGSALADVMYGGGIYIPATFLIKGLMGLVCSMIAKNGRFVSYIIACVTGGVIMVLGYGLFETFLFGFKAALASGAFNLIQFAGGVLLAVPCYFVVNTIKKSIAFSDLN